MIEEEIARLVHQRLWMLFKLLAILFICYFTLPLALALFPDKMNQSTGLGSITWTWLYTFLQIPMTWILGWIYWHKSKQVDQQVQAVLQEDKT